MAKNTPTAQPVPVEGLPAIQADHLAEQPKTVGQKGTKRTLNVDRYLTLENKEVTAKVESMSHAVQMLAEVKDTLDKGAEFKKQADEQAAKASRLLVLNRINGLASVDEVNRRLGDVFGFKMKGQGNGNKSVPAGHPDASKTPFGYAEDLRKRIVRLADAADYCRSPDDGKAFYTSPVMLPVDDVQNVVDGVSDGTYSIWTAYELLATIRKDAMEDVEKPRGPFDPKAVLSFIEKLSEAGGYQKVADNPALIAAYIELRKLLNEIFATDAVDEAIGQMIAAHDAAKAEKAENETKH